MPDFRVWAACVLGLLGSCRHFVYIIKHYYIIVVRVPCACCLETGVVSFSMVSQCVFIARNSNLGKVMFSQACAKNLSTGAGVHPLGRHPLP